MVLTTGNYKSYFNFESILVYLSVHIFNVKNLNLVWDYIVDSLPKQSNAVYNCKGRKKTKPDINFYNCMWHNVN